MLGIGRAYLAIAISLAVTVTVRNAPIGRKQSGTGGHFGRVCEREADSEADAGVVGSAGRLGARPSCLVRSTRLLLRQSLRGQDSRRISQSHSVWHISSYCLASDSPRSGIVCFCCYSGLVWILKVLSVFQQLEQTRGTNGSNVSGMAGSRREDHYPEYRVGRIKHERLKVNIFVLKLRENKNLIQLNSGASI